MQGLLKINKIFFITPSSKYHDIIDFLVDDFTIISISKFINFRFNNLMHEQCSSEKAGASPRH